MQPTAKLTHAKAARFDPASLNHQCLKQLNPFSCHFIAFHFRSDLARAQAETPRRSAGSAAPA